MEPTKVDETNQTIGVLQFENNFLAEKTKKLQAELFQVRAQFEKTSNTKQIGRASCRERVFNWV